MPAPFSRIALLPAAAMLALSGGAAAQAPARPRVLAFFYPSGEIDHYMFAREAIREFDARAEAQGYSFVATSDWDELNDARLKDVKLVVWLNGLPRTAEQQAAFQRYMDRGGAWLGFHISALGANDWSWYHKAFLGGAMMSSGALAGSNWPSLPGRVNVDDAAHPVMRGVPQSFITPITEWYGWTPSPRANPDIKVLLTLDKSNFPMGAKNMLNGGDIPVAWSNRRYHMLYLNYGHGDRIYTSPALVSMIDNGVRWLLSGAN